MKRLFHFQCGMRCILWTAPMVLVAVLVACAPQADVPRQPQGPVGRVPQQQAEPEIPEFGPVTPLADLLERAFRVHYTSLRGIYSPPTGLMRKGCTVLAERPVVLPVAKEVDAYAVEGDILAYADSGGIVHIYGGFSCPRLALPGDLRAESLFLSPDDPLLLVAEQVERRLRVYDLRYCAERSFIHISGRPVNACASARAERAALADEAHGLRLGPLDGPLETKAKLRFGNLDLAFTPAGDLLLSLDQGGWLTVWNAEDGSLVDKFFFEGGPFVKAEFKGRLLRLTAESGRIDVYDLTGHKVDSGLYSGIPNKERFFLRDGVVFYETAQPIWTKRLVLQRRSLKAVSLPQVGVIQIQDIDGEIRYYDSKDGMPLKEGFHAEQADLRREPVALGREYSFTLEGRGFRLADVVYAVQGDRLFCRYIPDKGYYLWWEKADKAMKNSQEKGMLIKRISLSEGIAPERIRFALERSFQVP